MIQGRRTEAGKKIYDFSIRFSHSSFGKWKRSVWTQQIFVSSSSNNDLITPPPLWSLITRENE